VTKTEAKNLIEVMLACKASGISSMKCGDLELKFGNTGDAAPISVPETVEAVETPSVEQLKEIEELQALQNNADDADDDLATMAIEDPVEFEELLVQRELTDGGNGSDNFIEVENRRVEQDL
jgi:hypothetical protein